MAKRRKEKDEEEEDPDFKIPKFDEEGFVRKERVKIKATFIAFIFAFVVALITFGFWILLDNNPFQWTLVLLFGLFTTAWVRYLYMKLNIDLEQLGKKGLFSSYAIYFLTWLFILIVMVNPPFYDMEAPNIEIVALPDMQEPGGTVKIIAKVTDNDAIQNNVVAFLLTQNESIIIEKALPITNMICMYEFENTNHSIGTYHYTMKATDVHNHQTTVNGTFIYNPDIIKLTQPQGTDTPPGPDVTYSSTIKFDVKAPVNWMYYSVSDGSVINYINVTKNDEDFFYESSPYIKGWIRGKEVNVTAYAKYIYYFENIETEYNNTIIDTTQHYFNVSDDSEIGTKDPPTPDLPQPRYIFVPGFETILFIISLAGVLLIVKYRKKKRNNDP